MKSTAAIFASIFSSAVALPTQTPDLVMTNFAGTACTALATTSAIAVVADKCDPQSTTTSRKFAAGTTAGSYSMDSYAGTALCDNTAASTLAMTADGTTCTITDTATRATLMPFASAATKATDLTFGFYSDAACNTGVQATAQGSYGYLNGASGTCLPMPGGATAAKIEYTSAMMDVSLYLSGTGAGTCGSTPTGVVSGAPGTCKQLTDVNAAGVTTGALTVARAAGVATGGYCPATGDCYIYVFPAGAFPAPAMSGASSASLAAVTAAGAVAAAVLLA